VHAERLRQLAEALQVERLRQDEAIAREVLELALNVAQQMLRATIQARPESILVVIREALQSLPTLSGHHKVVVHPDDAAVVREWLAKEHGHLSWKVAEDGHAQPGGFRFESDHSELDASLETRWREITGCLGTDTTWMD
jgi:flagellar assembly protein FliH